MGLALELYITEKGVKYILSCLEAAKSTAGGQEQKTPP